MSSNLGPTGVGIHLLTRDRVEVLDAIRSFMEVRDLEWVGGGPEGADLGETRLLLLPPQGRWSSLYPEDPYLADTLAPALAAAVRCPVLVVGQIEEAAVFYRAYDESGVLGDEFHSCPDYEKEFDEADASEEELERTRGEPEIVAALLGMKAGDLASTLAASRIEHLRDVDVNAVPADNKLALAAIQKNFALPDLEQDFDVLWHLGFDDAEDVDLRYLAYGHPEESLRDQLRDKLDGLLSRLRRQQKAAPQPESESEPEPQSEPEPSKHENPNYRGMAKMPPPGGGDDS